MCKKKSTFEYKFMDLWKYSLNDCKAYVVVFESHSCSTSTSFHLSDNA
jgi:hypothetical protein